MVTAIDLQLRFTSCRPNKDGANLVQQIAIVGPQTEKEDISLSGTMGSLAANHQGVPKPRFARSLSRQQSAQDQ